MNFASVGMVQNSQSNKSHNDNQPLCADPIRQLRTRGLNGFGRLRISDFGFRIADCGLQIADCGLRIADCGLRIVDCGFAKGLSVSVRSDLTLTLSLKEEGRLRQPTG